MIDTDLSRYETYLRSEERSANTIAKYLRDLRVFFTFMGNESLCKEAVVSFKGYLTESYAPASVNSMLAAVNGFLEWSGMPQMKVKPLKIQKCLFAKPEKELTQEEYWRLIKAAEEKDNHRLAMLLQTICATGIRVSELRFITTEALRAGRTEIRLKGKCRTVLLPQELAERLRRYARAQDIQEGPLFRTRTGRPLDRSNIWHEMKTLCREAGVMPEKVFPHNLRHLFAKCFYEQEKDLAHLADLLGHSSIETTRIYVAVSARAHEQILEKMRLIV